MQMNLFFIRESLHLQWLFEKLKKQQNLGVNLIYLGEKQEIITFLTDAY